MSGDSKTMTCFFTGCNKTYTAAYVLAKHCLKDHIKGNTFPDKWKCTSFWMRAKDEKARLQARRRLGMNGTSPQVKKAKAGEDETGANPMDSAVREDQGDKTAWVVRPCYVRADASGNMISPLQYGGLAIISPEVLGSRNSFLRV